MSQSWLHRGLMAEASLRPEGAERSSGLVMLWSPSCPTYSASRPWDLKERFMLFETLKLEGFVEYKIHEVRVRELAPGRGAP